MTIKIIDLYSGNKFEPAKILTEGYTGVIFKGGQGGWADCPRVHPEWWKIAADYGLYRGWYWLCDSRFPAPYHIEEMKRFKIFQDVGELGIWIDMEKPVLSMTERDYWKTTYAGHRNVVDFAYLIHTEGHIPGIYTGPGAYELIMRGAPLYSHEYLATNDLWTAQYPYVFVPGVSKPKLYGKWTDWTWWQYREGPDVNLFNGTYDQFIIKYGDAPEEIPEEPNTGEPMPVPTPPTVVATAKTATNIKTVDGNPSGAVASLPVGGKFYGDWNANRTDIMYGRSKDGTQNGFYRSSGEFVPWSEPIKITAGANVTVDPYVPVTPPPVDPPIDPPPASDAFEVTVSFVNSVPTIVVENAHGPINVTVDGVVYGPK